MQEVISWFISSLIHVVIVGLLVGSGSVCAISLCYRRRQAKRLAEAQMNPAFKFQDTHDPSGTAGGIPASNPIPEEAMQTDVDNAIATDRGLIDSPDPRLKGKKQ